MECSTCNKKFDKTKEIKDNCYSKHFPEDKCCDKCWEQLELQTRKEIAEMEAKGL